MSDPHPASGDGFTATPPDADIASTAVRQGCYSWLSSRLFEIVGGWVTTTPDPEVGAYFGTSSAEWAWHAELWAERLPELREVSREALIVSPDETVTEALGALDALTDTLDRIDGLAGFCARLERVYAAHATAASPVRDAPTIRTLDLVRSDLVAAQGTLADLAANHVTTDTSARVSSAASIAVFDGFDRAFSLICTQKVTLRA